MSEHPKICRKDRRQVSSMKMSKFEQNVNIFLDLLSTCLHDTQVDDPGVNPAEWKTVMTLARGHNVFPLVFEKASECESFANLPEYTRYAMLAMTIVAEQAKRTEAFLNVYRRLLNAGLHPIVLKGIVCRQLYGEYGDHRPSGDEDLLVVKSEYERLQAVLGENGYISGKGKLTEAQLNEIEEVSFYGQSDGLSIDVHWNLMGKENGLRKQMNDCFLEGAKECREELIAGIPVITLNHTSHLLFLILHAFKHLTIGGFGIRPVMDILLYTEKYGAECDWPYLHGILKQLNADQFLVDLMQIGNDYLGFHLPLPFEAGCPDELLFEIVSSGAFGNTTQEQRAAAQMINAAICGRDGGSQSKFKNMLYTAFPNRANMVDPYPILNEKPWLLPVCWAKRWARFLKTNKVSSADYIIEGMKISNRRIALLKKYDVL